MFHTWNMREIQIACNEDGSVELRWFNQVTSRGKTSSNFKGAGTIAKTQGGAALTPADAAAAPCPARSTDCVVLAVVNTANAEVPAGLLALRPTVEGKAGDAAAKVAARVAAYHTKCAQRAAEIVELKRLLRNA